MRCERLLQKGQRFSEEGYVGNIMYNEVSPQSEVGVLRSICLPSMKGGYHLVHAALRKNTGAVTAAHCLCPVGLSGTCQHVVGLLLSAADRTTFEPPCTDVPCAWIVPPGAKKLETSKPLSDITFAVANQKASSVKRKRLYDPCPQTRPLDMGTFRRSLQQASPRAVCLCYNKCHFSHQMIM
ncbi:hypothetical protein MTO96_000507 [Rhipicephalus appendiculatus]